LKRKSGEGLRLRSGKSAPEAGEVADTISSTSLAATPASASASFATHDQAPTVSRKAAEGVWAS
jgi:hypothetical protein